MDWTDEGIVLAARRHGETSAVVQLLTRAHGRHAGLARGGAGSRARGLYQAGNRVEARWRGRLAEHLGSYTCELVRAHAAGFLDDAPRLGALTSACAVAEATLPERQSYPRIYDAFLSLIEALGGDGPAWAAVYVRWELGLLDELGFGLDLKNCAATGATGDLVYVSPKTGRAVSRTAGAPWHDRLLTLPSFLIGGNEAETRDVAAGLKLTGEFLDRHLFAAHGRKLPAARERFVDRFIHTASISDVKKAP